MNDDSRPVNIQEIIPLVEKKPVLWDHRLELFKHKNATLAAWDEICLSYNEAYANLSQADKNSYRGVVIRKWRNVKDSWRKNLVKTIRGENVYKKYVYEKELLFLKQGMKIKLRKKQKSLPISVNLTDDEMSCHSDFQIKSELINTDSEEIDSKEELQKIFESELCHNTDTEDMDDKPEFNEFGKTSNCSNNNCKPRDEQAVLHEMPSSSYSQSTISNPAELEISKLLNSSEQEDRHISFIKGVLPSLRKLNERQVLKFQMGVLRLIQNIQENT